MTNHKTIDALSCAIAELCDPIWDVPVLKQKPKVCQIGADVAMDATIDDCHHNGASEWGVLRNDLYTRCKMHPPKQWVKVNRVSYTPRRMKLLSRLVRMGEAQ